jgi:hypothetical protein
MKVQRKGAVVVRRLSVHFTAPMEHPQALQHMPDCSGSDEQMFGAE